MEIKIGHPAPNFSLVDTQKKEVKLSDFKGQYVVLLFFPLAFTSVCTEELCSVRDQLNIYNQLNTTVLAISVDSPFTLAKFKQEQQLNFTLLSDFNKEVSTLYDTIYTEFIGWMKGVSKRSAFIISPDGIILHKEVLNNAGEVPNFDAIKQIIQQNQI